PFWLKSGLSRRTLADLSSLGTMSLSGSLGLLATALFGAASASDVSASSAERIRLRVEPVGEQSFALYGVPDLGRMEHDIFWSITKPGEMVPVEIDTGSAFVLRSTDMKFRAIVLAEQNHDAGTRATHPWKICFVNPMLDPGAKIELKHSISGFAWLEEGSRLCQVTDHSHKFELRNEEKAPVAEISVKRPNMRIDVSKLTPLS
ncbi:unnamed protein product, partial [Prorocentrum cordatum]